ncbi:MAG: hypothetical protein P4L16_06445 [Chlamydiales bacterium]|nr:hypothetical protein [Chlamydiales bacterium]
MGAQEASLQDLEGIIMGIEKYTSYFHDGSILSIKHTNNKMEIAMESAEMDKEDLLESFLLSNRNTIRGILHIDGIKNLEEDEQLYKGEYIMKSNCPEIYDFILGINQIELQVIWTNIPAVHQTKDFSVLKIEAEKIYWENIPDLVDPFW